jgi:hypothetical protein
MIKIFEYFDQKFQDQKECISVIDPLKRSLKRKYENIRMNMKRKQYQGFKEKIGILNPKVKFEKERKEIMKKKEEYERIKRMKEARR